MKKLKPQARRHLIDTMTILAARQWKAAERAACQRNIRRLDRALSEMARSGARAVASLQAFPVLGRISGLATTRIQALAELDPVARHHAAFERGLRRSRS